MVCTQCNTVNDAESVFCIGCGRSMTNQAGFHGSGNSTETEVVNIGQGGFTPSGYTPSQPQVEVPRRSGVSPLLLVGLGIAVLFGLVGAVAFILVGPTIGGGGETLPSHLGMFVQSDAKDKVDEIKRQDFTNAIEARTAITKDGSLPYLVAQPSLILYADSKDIPVNDVRLVQLDTLKDDGTMKTLDFQVAPINGKNDMKRIRIPTQLATGKYAFTFFDGYFNEGKHKFWPFQVKDSSKTDNGDSLKAWSVGPKPKDPPAAASPRGPSSFPPATNVAPPMTATSGGRIAYSTTSSLILRAGPSQLAAKIRNLRSGEAVEILGYSSNTEYFNGRNAPFAQVRTSSGQVGWAFSAYLR